MPAATPTAAAKTPAIATANGSVMAIPLEQLRENLKNPRTSWDEAGLKELAESVKVHGILEPLLVREIPAGKGTTHEIVAGARRFRAARLAGLAKVPCLVKDLTDQDALAVMLVENLQREGLAPFEEAAGYERLHKEAKVSVPDIARRIGKSVGYVYARLKLLDMIPAGRKALEEGRIDSGHGVLIARHDPATQKRLLEWTIRDNASCDDLEEYIQQEIHRALSGAPWKWDDATLLPEAGACSACPFRSTKERNPDVKENVCLKPPCYEEKLLAFAERRAKEEAAKLVAKAEAAAAEVSRGGIKHGVLAPKTGGKAKNAAAAMKEAAAASNVGEVVKLTGYGGGYGPEAKGALDPHLWTPAKDKLCPHTKTGVLVAGSIGNGPAKLKKGDIFPVCTKPADCRIHNPRQAPAKKSPAEIERARKVGEKVRHEKAVQTRMLEELVKAAKPDRANLELIAGSFFGRLWHDLKKPIFARRGWEPKKARGYGGNDYDSVAEEHVGKMSDSELFSFLVELAVAMDAYGNGWQADGSFEKAAARHGITPAKVEKLLEADAKAAGKAKEAEKAKSLSLKKAKLARHQKRG